MTKIAKLNFHILTLFPSYFVPLKCDGVISRAIQNNLISLESIDLRNYAYNERKNVDSKPYGGGDGMVLRADVLEHALSDNSLDAGKSFVINLSPSGVLFDSKLAKELLNHSSLTLICGRYSGVDQRFIDKHVDLELSIGSYVVSGGELPAAIIVDAMSRFLPGVLGNKESALLDSFEGGLLEGPVYTRPFDFHGLTTPEVLLSGDHKKIEDFRADQNLSKTRKVRPDILKKKPKKV